MAALDPPPAALGQPEGNELEVADAHEATAAAAAIGADAGGQLAHVAAGPDAGDGDQQAPTAPNGPAPGAANKRAKPVSVPQVVVKIVGLAEVLATSGCSAMLVIVSPDQGEVWRYATPDLHELLATLDAMGIVTVVKSRSFLHELARRSGAMRDKQLGDLKPPMAARMLRCLLNLAIPQRKEQLPFSSSTEQQVRARYPWWPEAMPYKSPKELSPQQRQRLLLAVAGVDSMRRMPFEQLYGTVARDVSGSLNAVALSPIDWAMMEAVLAKEFGGEVDDIAWL